MNIYTGFLLTRQARDTHNGPQIELWLSTESGPAQVIIQGEQPVFFVDKAQQQRAVDIAHSSNIDVRLQAIDLKSFDHQPLVAVYCTTIAHARQLAQSLKDNDILVLEDDIKLADRYLMERFIQGSLAVTGQTQVINGSKANQYLRITQAKCKAHDYSPQLNIVSLDIECSEKGVLYSIGLDSPRDSRVIMIGAPEEATTAIQWVENEKALLLALIEWFKWFDPDVVIGWSVIDFDFKLLHRRAEYHRIPLTLGRSEQTAYVRTLPSSGQTFISIAGRVVLDGIDTLKTATYQFRSWSLESVSQTLLGEGKQIHNVHDRMAEINQMFRSDKPALAGYNLQDCVLVNRIFEHTHLMDFAIERTKLTGIELDRVGGSVAAFTNLYLPRLHRAQYAAPNLHPENWIASPGGYVMDSIPGLYDSVLVLDFKSLYPSIIRSFLIDPLGLIEGLNKEVGKAPDQAVEGFRGGQFDREKHFLPSLISQLWQARDQAKANNEKAFSQAIKIIMNSFYGVLGSSGCRFFDTRLASSITLRGHQVLKQTKEWIEQHGYQVIYGDTDSVFVYLGKVHSHQEADQVGKTLVNVMNQSWQDTLRQQYNLDCYLELEYETHFRKFLMPTIRGAETGSKKRYAGVKTSEQSETIVFKGLESVRTDWTPLAQRFQRQLYQMVFDNQDPSEYVREFVEATSRGDYDQELVYQKRLRRKLNDYQKNIPPQVKAARMADAINEQLGRPLQYQNRGRIEYVITTNGPEPKEYLNSPIDYQHYVDKQLRPVAEAILPFINQSFDDLSAPQMGLF
ncbi:DNA polymerase II [Vibrio hippocampi]|uniref:DNA polymerase n=1 Tax=Vibrio hippocampi TaxID=654686 RepID=A0ABM8ZJ39_9VIBR|nr:DNA polymerase II [Vibrio hippocampi]CAH0526365.1 DNA polymerase II [Vibrio hippocampi]